MGLCKCSKKRVTNQFCFEHKVNVCENCMIEEGHQTCIVGPYLKWLDNSSFDPNCGFCETSLLNAPCVRLCCYHIFHQECLNNYGQQMPPTTAPAGYICMKCTIPIFSFNTDKNSPVANRLKQVLSNFSWTNEGLLDMNKQNPTTSSSSSPSSSSTSLQADTRRQSQGMNGYSNKTSITSTNNSNDDSTTTNQTPKLLHNLANKHSFTASTPISMNQMTSFISSHSDLGFGSTSSMRNKFETERRSLLSSDTLEDKYRHRSLLDFISRWFRYRTTNFRNQSGLAFGAYTRLVIMAILIICALFCLIYFFAVFGRIYADNDPMLNPENNPDIHHGDDS